MNDIIQGMSNKALSAVFWLLSIVAIGNIDALIDFADALLFGATALAVVYAGGEVVMDVIKAYSDYMKQEADEEKAP